MYISTETSVKEILEVNPEAIKVFAQHDVDIACDCDERIHDCSLELCESMCKIEDLEGLIKDLQYFFDNESQN
ncbi:MAG: hypothetical protein K2X27_09675 [Candidatus Obscuribacterales bacterium]|nr:hypothetical protein [Candidatus Obscuribacterales bacterium]